MLKIHDIYCNSRRSVHKRKFCHSFLYTALVSLVFPLTTSAKTHAGLTNRLLINPLKEGRTVSGNDSGAASPVISNSNNSLFGAWQIKIELSEALQKIRGINP